MLANNSFYYITKQTELTGRMMNERVREDMGRLELLFQNYKVASFYFSTGSFSSGLVAIFTLKNRLRDRDSNPDTILQRDVSYH